jgi:hypothetical protein
MNDYSLAIRSITCVTFRVPSTCIETVLMGRLGLLIIPGFSFLASRVLPHTKDFVSHILSRNGHGTQVHQQWLQQAWHKSLLCMQHGLVLQQRMSKERLAEPPQAAL